MLRSLVGSEMCIRDSKEGILDKLKLLPKLGQFASWMPKVKKGRGECQDCLLYTSDAADDLLCVDLGGRRIIKTTNTNR